MGKRRQAREWALQVLFQYDFREVDSEEASALFFEGQTVSPEIREFADRLINGVWQNRQEIDQLIQVHSTNWRLDRMPVVDRNILRIAVYELLFEDDIASSVSLNEAIEIAKRFGSEESASFVNGVLDPIAKNLREETCKSP